MTTVIALTHARHGVTLTAVRVTIGFVVLTGTAGIAAWSVWRNRLPRARVWLLVALGVAIAGFLGAFAQSLATGGLWTAGIALFLAVLFTFDLVHHAGPASGKATSKSAAGSMGKLAATLGANQSNSNSGRPRRIFHSIMALITPTAVLAGIGVLAIALGYGAAPVMAIADTITTAI